jgi:CheY-like chemotaxis protein
MALVGRPIEILLVEDNPGDVRLAREALQDSKVHNTIHVVGDGVAALAFLRGEGAYATAPRPDLILLDLGLPRKDGREVLAEIKRDGDLEAIPVVILTTSAADRDILQSLALRVDGYMIKPIDLEQLIALVRAFADFHLAIITISTDQTELVAAG